MFTRSKKTDAAEVSLSSVVVMACFNLIFGGVLGFVFLSSIPAKAFASVEELESFQAENSQAQYPKPGQVYHLKGADSRSKTWENKRSLFLQGTANELTVSVAEINTWFAARFHAAKPDPNTSGVLLVPGTPNLSAEDADNVYLSLPLELIINGRSFSKTVFVKGSFMPGVPVRFEVERGYVNSAQLPTPAVASALMDTLMDAYRVSDEYQAMSDTWQRVESVEVIDHSLTFKLR